MRVIVTGSRYWTDTDSVWTVLTGLYLRTNHLLVVHGDCRNHAGNPMGADRLAGEWVVDAKRQGLNVEVEPHPAKWKEHGRKAGPIRNQAMVALGVWCQPCRVEGMVLAWPLGLSRGTRGCMELAEAAGLEVVNCTDRARRTLAYD